MAPSVKANGTPECDAVVVGSGPNGLAAAILLAKAGHSVRVIEAQPTLGGGARSAEVTLPGYIHDLGSAIHPLAAGSPFFRTLPLARFGLRWIQPEIALAHPFDDGTAAALYQSLEQTAGGLGEDGPAYSKLMSPLVRHWEALATEFLQPMLHVPRHPILLTRFGLSAVQSASMLAGRLFRNREARGLFAGLAAHSFLPLEAPVSAGIALVLAAAGHVVGWPMPEGGAQKITDALAGYLRELGGEIVTGQRVSSLQELPASRAVLLDLTPAGTARVAGAALPLGYKRHLERFPVGSGIFKIDYALAGPIPWTAEPCRRAGTVHVGGTFEEIARSEREVVAGRIPEHPFVLLAQQSLFDRTRAPDGRHTAWAYCHVPLGCNAEVTSAIEAQIERYAPGFKSQVLARQVSTPAGLEAANENLAGGNISGGAMDLWHLLARPVFSPCPYRTPLRGVYICSSSTPPGGGVHGMCGFHAAQAALRRELR